MYMHKEKPSFFTLVGHFNLPIIFGVLWNIFLNPISAELDKKKHSMSLYAV